MKSGKRVVVNKGFKNKRKRAMVIVWQEGDKSVDEIHPGWFAAKYKDQFVKEDGVLQPWKNIEFAKKDASRAEEKDIRDKEHARFKYRLKKYGLEED